MQTTSDVLIGALTSAANEELAKAQRCLRHCLEQLDDEQIWRRPAPTMNSIGNLILHLCGNLRQWVIAGIGGEPDVRQRPLEFAEQGPMPRAELLRRLEAVVAQAQQVLANVPAHELLRTRRIQGFEVTGFDALFDSVPHFRGHTQEIVHMTRHMLGDAYRFAWTPTTPEQGA